MPARLLAWNAEADKVRPNARVSAAETTVPRRKGPKAPGQAMQGEEKEGDVARREHPPKQQKKQ